MKKKLKVLDLFCGCGGLSQGFYQAGYEIYAGIDSDKDSLETFLYNFPKAKTFLGDIREFDDQFILSNFKSYDLKAIDNIDICSLNDKINSIELSELFKKISLTQSIDLHDLPIKKLLK